MFSLQQMFTAKPCLVIRWFVSVCVVLTLMGSAWAQSALPNTAPQAEAQGAGSRVKVKQTLLIDESHRLDFESVRTQVFKPFNPLERLVIGNMATWLRIQIEDADASTGPLFLHLIPAHIGQVTLYSPDSHSPATWHMRSVAPSELISRIKLGEAAQGAVFYLKIEAVNNSSILAFVGGRDQLNLHDAKLAVMMTFISTLTMVALMVFVWRTIRYFSWMSVLISALLMSYQIYYWIGIGYAYSILSVPLAIGVAIVTPNVIANFSIAGGILVLLGCTLFPDQRWLRWLWLWSLLNVCLFVYAFFQPSVASRLSMSLWLVGPLILGASLTRAAMREPASLKVFSNKIAFSLLLITCLILEVVALRSGGVIGTPIDDLTTELFIKNIFTRFPQLLVIIALASWIFERIHANHLQVLSGELKKSKESLEVESKRLERQRKFTTMLAHELKNPLAVSHMALSGIEARLSKSDPLMDRAASIKQSLQDIDAIIDRCSEIDGFEQGELPMSMSTFSLNHLLALIKETNKQERIYVLKRGLHDDVMLTSDIQYLKIIFSNLLTNALKYSPPDTLIELSVQSVAGLSNVLKFNVTNEVGEAGTPEPSLAFERYYRAEAARNQSGAGLGLWLSQALAHSLGSEVVMQQDKDKISFGLTLPYV